MNEATAKIIVEGFLKGGFDVFEALLGAEFIYTAGDAGELTPDQAAAFVLTQGVALRGKIIGGGAVAMLLSMEDATKIVSLTNTGEATASDAMDEAAAGTLKEIADGSLGGGVANLSEQFGEDVELEEVEVVVMGEGGAADLSAYVGDPSIYMVFQFSSDPNFDSSGVFVYSQSLDDRVPASVAAGEGEDVVSEEEMQDILSGFTPEDETDHSGNGGGEAPNNLDVVMGIELQATARLGKVEVAIADVLNLGPGSIIEVGHLVDEPVELLVNNRLVARGDVVVVDEKFGLRITEIVSPQERIESLR